MLVKLTAGIMSPLQLSRVNDNQPPVLVTIQIGMLIVSPFRATCQDFDLLHCLTVFETL